MTYLELKKFVGNAKLPCTAETEDGEMMIIEHLQNENGKHFKLTIAQNNGWTRIEYHYEDGIIEVLYEK